MHCVRAANWVTFFERDSSVPYLFSAQKRPVSNILDSSCQTDFCSFVEITDILSKFHSLIKVLNSLIYLAYLETVQ